jgi:diacylglycerol kinase family enzyme
VERRLAAIGALVAAIALGVVLVHGLWGDVPLFVAGAVLAFLVVLILWVALTRSGARRTLALVLMVAAAVGLVLLVLLGPRPIEALFAVLLAGLVLGCTRRALPGEVVLPGSPVAGAAEHPVLIVNPHSGDGKAERAGLAALARAKGIEVVELQRGDDLRQLAVDAVERGADVLGMAGGDGSQALVASVAAEHDVAHVCVPAGTRNHLALDLGLDREDLEASLGAFTAGALERRIDLAEVNGRTFVNNVSLGVYAQVVQEPGYRAAKAKTTTDLLPTLLGPGSEAFDLQVDGPDGMRIDGPQVIQVSNDPYELTRLDGSFGRRMALDRGVLGVAVVKLAGDLDVPRFVTAQAAGKLDRFPGWRGWEAPELVVEAQGPVAAGVDGEALQLDPPLCFRSHPAAVRVRVPAGAPGIRIPRRPGLIPWIRDLLEVAGATR